MKTKLSAWWLLHMVNPVVRTGAKGAFKWVFRRYTLEVETLSGNWKARWTAAEHPYGYLLTGKDDENILGFCQTMYEIGMTLTTDQGFVNDIQKAVKKYSKRLDKQADVVDDEQEEKIALEEVKQVQAVAEMEPKARRKYERDVNGRFKAALKEMQKDD